MIESSPTGKFTTVVDFHGRHDDTAADYEQLDVHMASVGFRRAATDKRRETCSMVEYEYIGSVEDKQTLMELASWAVDRTLRERRRRRNSP